jgi:hypothetical protein
MPAAPAPTRLSGRPCSPAVARQASKRSRAASASAPRASVSVVVSLLNSAGGDATRTSPKVRVLHLRWMSKPRFPLQQRAQGVRVEIVRLPLVATSQSQHELGVGLARLGSDSRRLHVGSAWPGVGSASASALSLFRVACKNKAISLSSYTMQWQYALSEPEAEAGARDRAELSASHAPRARVERERVVGVEVEEYGAGLLGALGERRGELAVRRGGAVR